MFVPFYLQLVKWCYCSLRYYIIKRLEMFVRGLRTLFEFSRGKKAAAGARNICAMYEDNGMGESTAKKWFSRFKEDRLNTLIHNDLRQELANVMNRDHFTIIWHLHSMGNVQKSGVWVPHTLSQNHKNQRLAICASLFDHHRLVREQHRPFLSYIVTGDEKLCFYANIRKIKGWLSPNKRRISRKCSNFCTLALHFLASTAPFTIFKWQNFNM